MPLASTFRTRANTAGCPAGFTGTFSFVSRLSSQAGSPDITDLGLQVSTLSNGNLLQNADDGPDGIAATLTVPRAGAYADGILGPGESVDVRLNVCLANREPFQFFVDVLGKPLAP